MKRSGIAAIAVSLLVIGLGACGDSGPSHQEKLAQQGRACSRALDGYRRAIAVLHAQVEGSGITYDDYSDATQDLDSQSAQLFDLGRTCELTVKASFDDARDAYDQAGYVWQECIENPYVASCDGKMDPDWTDADDAVSTAESQLDTFVHGHKPTLGDTGGDYGASY